MRALLLVATAVSGLLWNAAAADAAVLKYAAVLSGATEVPAVVTPGTGSAKLTVDTVAKTYRLVFDFRDLTGNSTVAHIHGPTETAGIGTAGVMTQTPSFAAFPVGVTAGSFDQTFDMTLATTWNPAFVTTQGSIANAESTFLASLAGGTAYLNIHSSTYPRGEINGFFTVAPIPLPAGVVLSLSALALLGLVGAGRKSLV